MSSASAGDMEAPRCGQKLLLKTTRQVSSRGGNRNKATQIPGWCPGMRHTTSEALRRQLSSSKEAGQQCCSPASTESLLCPVCQGCRAKANSLGSCKSHPPALGNCTITGKVIKDVVVLLICLRKGERGRVTEQLLGKREISAGICLGRAVNPVTIKP